MLTATSTDLFALTDRFRSLLEQSPVIPAVRAVEFTTPAALAHGKIVYVLCGDIETLPIMSAELLAAGKVPIVNLDLVQGLSRDSAAVAFVARHGFAGIISTHPEPLRAARHAGLFAIARTFLLDSAAVHAAMRSIERGHQDAVEVLPACVAPHLIHHLRSQYPSLPVIAGGLVSSFREIEGLRDRGVIAVSVSDSNLWLKS